MERRRGVWTHFEGRVKGSPDRVDVGMKDKERYWRCFWPEPLESWVAISEMGKVQVKQVCDERKGGRGHSVWDMSALSIQPPHGDVEWVVGCMSLYWIESTSRHAELRTNVTNTIENWFCSFRIQSDVVSILRLFTTYFFIVHISKRDIFFSPPAKSFPDSVPETSSTGSSWVWRNGGSGLLSSLDFWWKSMEYPHARFCLFIWSPTYVVI